MFVIYFDRSYTELRDCDIDTDEKMIYHLDRYLSICLRDEGKEPAGSYSYN